MEWKGVSRQHWLLNNSEVEMHDWCGAFHFHTFKRSLLAPAPNRPSGLHSSKPGMDLAFLVRLFGTRVALFYGGAPVVVVGIPHLYLLLTQYLRAACYFERRAQSASLMRNPGWSILAPSLMWLENLRTPGLARQSADTLKNILV